MIGWNILLWARVELASLKSASSLQVGLRGTGLHFLGTCYPVSRWRIEFSVPLLTLLQLQGYLVPCILAQIIIIPKLPNTRCKQSLSELSSLCTEHLPNCYSSNPSVSLSRFTPDWCFREHISHALPTEMIFYLLRSICSDGLIRVYSQESMLDILEIIIEWLQVSCY